MRLDAALQQSTTSLQTAGIESARLDCLVLLEDILQRDRAYLLAHPDLELNDNQISLLNTYITQRSQHTPLAYIRGKVAFSGREFQVSPAVLVPRPETESMIELLLANKADLPEHARIADIGTGSGCIGITAALELPDTHVRLYDIDDKALAIATSNAKRLHAAVDIVRQDLLTNQTEDTDVILTNLPYVPTDYAVNRAAQHEPDIALFSGDDGLEAYRTLWNQLSAMTKKPSHIFTESLIFQHKDMAHMARHAGYALDETRGLIQHFGRL